MADINKINLYGTVYNIEDEAGRASAESAQITADTANETANAAKTTAKSALSKANANTTLINNVKGKIPVISYNDVKQQIEITKGV